MPAIYGNAYEIVQTPEYVAIRYEMIHETRIIPLDPSTGSGSPRAESRGDNRPKLSPAIRLYMGDARGHWEGNSLVVETMNFTDRTHFGYNNRYNSQKFTLTERFTPVVSNTLQWQVTFNDPEVWTRPFTFATLLSTRDNSQPVFEYACHEGNLGLEHTPCRRLAPRNGSDRSKRPPSAQGPVTANVMPGCLYVEEQPLAVRAERRAGELAPSEVAGEAVARAVRHVVAREAKDPPVARQAVHAWSHGAVLAEHQPAARAQRQVVRHVQHVAPGDSNTRRSCSASRIDLPHLPHLRVAAVGGRDIEASVAEPAPSSRQKIAPPLFESLLKHADAYPASG